MMSGLKVEPVVLLVYYSVGAHTPLPLRYLPSPPPPPLAIRVVNLHWVSLTQQVLHLKSAWRVRPASAAPPSEAAGATWRRIRSEGAAS